MMKQLSKHRNSTEKRGRSRAAAQVRRRQAVMSAHREGQSSLDVPCTKGPRSRLLEARQLRCGVLKDPFRLFRYIVVLIVHRPNSLALPCTQLVQTRCGHRSVASPDWMASRVRRVAGSSAVWGWGIKQVIGQLPLFNSMIPQTRKNKHIVSA